MIQVKNIEAQNFNGFGLITGNGEGGVT